MALAFICLLITALIFRAVPEWEPLTKGDAMKTLFATVFAALLAAMAVMAYATPTSQTTDMQAPLPTDEDKDKDKDKKDG